MVFYLNSTLERYFLSGFFFLFHSLSHSQFASLSLLIRRRRKTEKQQNFMITVTFIVVFVCANMLHNMIRLSDFGMESIETGIYFHIQFKAKVTRMLNVHKSQVAKFNLHQKRHQVGQLQPKCEERNDIASQHTKKHCKKE